MKIFFTAFALLAVILAVYPFLDQAENKESLSGLPWQIEILPDGSSRVFGLQIGESRLLDAMQLLGNDMDLGIITATDSVEAGNLEMYYGYYKAGLLSGKLILQTRASTENIKHWLERSPRFEYMASGLAKKHILLDDDLQQVLQETVVNITFVPSVNLDEAVILARFGEPEERVSFAGVSHFLYPKKGLDIALHENSKDVLQYVRPADFEQLIQPLR